MECLRSNLTKHIEKTYQVNDLNHSFSENAETSCKEYCGKAIEHDPSNPEAYQMLANCLLSEGENEVCVLETIP